MFRKARNWKESMPSKLMRICIWMYVNHVQAFFSKPRNWHSDNFFLFCKDKNVPHIVPSEYRILSTTRNPTEESTFQQHFVLGDRFHSSSEPHKSPLCRYHDINLCCQANTIKTSTQESQNNRKNVKRLRSSCMQSFEVHIAFNYLMDYYQNEEVVIKQRKAIEKSLTNGQKISRDKQMRFVIS